MHRKKCCGAMQSGHHSLGTTIWAPQSGQTTALLSPLSFVTLSFCTCLAQVRTPAHSSLCLWGEASLTVTGRRRADISPALMLQALAPQRPLSLDRLPDTSLRVKGGLRVRAPTASSFGIEFVDVRDLVASLRWTLYHSSSCIASFGLIPRPVRSGCTGHVAITLKIDTGGCTLKSSHNAVRVAWL